MTPRLVRAPRRATSLMLAALLIGAVSARADDTFSVSFNTTDVPTGYVTYTDSASGAKTTEDVYIGAFSNVTETGVGQLGQAPQYQGFCIDLWHNMNGGDSFQGTTAPATNVASQSGWFPYSGYTPRVADPTLTSQLNYLGSAYLALNAKFTGGGLTLAAYNDAVGAVQLGIWYLIDKNFAVSNVSDPNGQLLADYNGNGTGAGILGLLSGTKETIAGLTFNGWSSIGNYAVGTLISVDRTSTQDPLSPSTEYQNMITWNTHDLTTQSIAPEPSTFALAGIGALAFIGYGLRRRSRA